MTETPRTLRHGWGASVIFALSAAALWVLAGLVMFSAFMYYDDEGYVLLSLRNFAAHGKLYDAVFTQYGPFPFVVHYCLQALGIELTHTAGRILTLGTWGLAALGCAGIVATATRHLILRLAVLASTFVYLWVMASEPSHPGGLITALTAMLAWLGYRWIGERRIRPWAILTGAGTAALLLTKINIGVFAACSTAAWLCLHFENDRIRRWAPAVLAVGITLLPFALMRPLLGAPWAMTFAVIFAAGGIMTISAAAISAGRQANGATVTALLASAALTSVVIAAIPLLRGTSFRGLLDGVLLRPMRHPVQFSLAFTWPPGTWAAMLLGVALFAAAGWYRRVRKPRYSGRIVAGSRLVVALGTAIALLRFPTISPSSAVLAFSIPWLWAFVWPLAGEFPGIIAAGRWLGLLFLGQTLHAFPVPGSQIAWGTFLFLPLTAVGAWSALRYLATDAPRLGHGAWRWVPPTAVALLALVVATRLTQTALRYRDGHDLNLPGAEPIRLPERTAALYHVLTLNAAAHADVLFSLPGMFSFNMWTGLPTPTLANVTHWFSLLEAGQQQEIVDALEAHPRACIIIQRGHLEFLAKRGLGAAGPLYDYIGRNYSPGFTIDEFEFCVRRDRIITPFLLGEMITSATPPRAADPDNTAFKMSVLVPPDRSIAAVEIAAIEGASLTLDAKSARVEVTPINMRGEPTGPTQARAWPFSISGPSQVSIYFNRLERPRPVRGGLIVLRDSTHAEVAIGRLRE